MSYNFDTPISRKNTDSIKFDFAKQRHMPEDVLPLWVADMDFQTAPAVIEALKAKVDHGIFGYSESSSDYSRVLKHWFKRHYEWDIEPSWLVKTPGVVFAITQAIQAFSSVGEGILIQEPVYYPFRESIELNRRHVVVNPLSYKDGAYQIDFDDFEQKIVDHKVKIFILCNPHNPVGRVWKEEELRRLGNICLRHHVLIIADEIHADFTYPGHKHHVFANLDPQYLDCTITCTSPSKTFNLAGLQVSNILIKNPTLRQQFKNQIAINGYSQLPITGLVSCQAAYEHGDSWLDALRDYLKQNLDYIRERLTRSLPTLGIVDPEGTYLLWLDFNGYGLDDDAINQRIIHDAKLWLDGGTMFGENGAGFQRINIACPRATIEEALNRLIQSFKVLENK